MTMSRSAASSAKPVGYRLWRETSTPAALPGFLHLGAVDPNTLSRTNPLYGNTLDRSVQMRVGDAPWGTRYAAYRDEDQEICWRFANFLFPFWTQSPQGHFDTYVSAAAMVPMDDTPTPWCSVSPGKSSGRSSI